MHWPRISGRGNSPEMSERAMTWRGAVAATAARVGDGPAASWLCETASGADNGDEFRSMLDGVVSARAAAHLEHMVSRVLAGEPLQYALGRWSFRRLDLMVDRRVLIPRPETELIVDHVLGFLRGRPGPVTVVDLGTGSGAIGLSLLHEMPPGSATVWMTDESSGALDVARANAAGAGTASAGARFALGSWYDALDPSLRGSVDVIVSNPPYVAVGDPELDDSVRAWEPPGALLAGAEGLDDLRIIVAGAAAWLAPAGTLIVETGHTQGTAVSAMCRSAGLADVQVLRDLAGHERFVSAVRV